MTTKKREELSSFMRIRVFMMPLFILDKNKGKQKKNNTKK